MRPRLLRPPLSHHARPTLRHATASHNAARRVDRLFKPTGNRHAFAALRPGGVPSPSCSPTRPRRTSRPVTATRPRLFSATGSTSAGISSPSVGSVARWTALSAPASPPRTRRRSHARPGARPAHHAKAVRSLAFRTEVHRTPARRPCPGRRDWRGWDYGGRSAPAALPPRGESGRRALQEKLSITRLIAASSSARADSARRRARCSSRRA